MALPMFRNYMQVLYILIFIDNIYRNYDPNEQFLQNIFFYPIIFILSPFLLNHITSCLGSCVDMVSNIDPVSMICALSLFNNSLATSAKCLGGTAINIYRNHDDFYIESALTVVTLSIQIYNGPGRHGPQPDRVGPARHAAHGPVRQRAGPPVARKHRTGPCHGPGHGPSQI